MRERLAVVRRFELRNAIFVGLAGVVAYLNSMHGAFILDDRTQIIENPHIHHLWPVWDVVRFTTRPLASLTFAVNYAISGIEVWSYHAVNLALHIAAGLALGALARATLVRSGAAKPDEARAASLALAIALLWVVHPLHTEAVTYVVQRSEVLAGLFTFLTLLALARAAGTPRAGRWTAIAVFYCALGMASKQVMVAVPVLALAYDRVFLSESWRGVWRSRRVLHGLLFATTLLLPLFLAGATNEWQGSAGLGVTGVTPLRYALAQPLAIARYLHLAFWPAALCLDYGWPARSPATWALALAALAAIAIGTVLLLRRGNRAGFLGLAFAIPLAVTSSFIPTADPEFEHRMYVPLAAVVAAAVLCGDALLRRLAARAMWPARTAAIAGTLIVFMLGAALAARTLVRNRDYASELSIWSKTVQQRPGRARPRNGLALALEAAGRSDEAESQLREALRVEPEFPESHVNLGLILLRQGHTAEARAQFEAALRLDPQSMSARTNLGLVLSNDGQFAAAEEQLTRAVAMNPRVPGPYASLGIVLAKRGQDDQAARRFQQALTLAPNDPDLHAYLGSAWSRMGRADDARQQFEQSLRLDPGQVAAHLGLGRLLARQQHYAEARVELEQAVRLDSANAEARAQLGITCALGGQLDEGERDLRQALRMDPRSPQAMGGLGLVASSRGHDAEAAQWFAQAIALRPDDSALRVQLGAVEAQRGNTAEARRQFEAALAIEPQNPVARWGLQQLGGATPK